MKVTKTMRLWVRFCRLLFWTLARSREDWRAEQRFLDWYFNPRRKVGTEHIVITATNGSVVKNVYVNHGLPRLSIGQCFLVAHIEQGGRRHRMPRA